VENLDFLPSFSSFYANFTYSPYLKLGMALALFFFLLLILALLRRRVFHISMKGAVFGFFLGVFLMLFINFIIILGLSDKSKVQEFAVGEKRREAFGEIFASGVSNLGQVLGTSTVTLSRKSKTAEQVMIDILALPKEEVEEIRNLFCPGE